MSPVVYAARLGLSRGWVEFVQTLRTRQESLSNLIMAVVFLVVLYLQRDETIDGTAVSNATASLPGVLGMMVVFMAFMGTAVTLSLEREDGTLLRAKALPNGMVGYLVSKAVSMSLTTLLSVLVILVPGLFLFGGLAEGLARGWLPLLGVFALGLLAMLPFGAIAGSLFDNPRVVQAWGMLPLIGLVVVSGIFAPITVLPEWVQVIGQIFPVYWLGLGMRSALLPDSMLSVEIGESWRHLETVGVLGVWAVAGLVIAPIVLRRMARRESGSSVEARKQKAMQRVG